jgi:hypothetical protein
MTTKRKKKPIERDRRLVRSEQRALIVEALNILPNVWQVYSRLGKLIGVSYGSVINIARSENIKLIRFDSRRVRNPKLGPENTAALED